MQYRILALAPLVLLLLCLSCMKEDYGQILKAFTSMKGKQEITVVMVGDSTSGSEGSESGSSYGTFLKRKLATCFGTRVSLINSSRSDETFDRAKRHMAEDVLSYRPDMTLIMLGLTDSAEPGVFLQFFKDLVSGYFFEFQEAGVFAVLLTTTGFNDMKPGDGTFDRLQEFNETIKFQARLNHIPIIDVAAHMEQLRQTNPEEYRAMFGDRIHLNDRGQEYVADFVFQTIRQTVDKVK
jgi:lysophospholipase L1-like esterase